MGCGGGVVGDARGGGARWGWRVWWGGGKGVSDRHVHAESGAAAGWRPAARQAWARAPQAVCSTPCRHPLAAIHSRTRDVLNQLAPDLDDRQEDKDEACGGWEARTAGGRVGWGAARLAGWSAGWAGCVAGSPAGPGEGGAAHTAAAATAATTWRRRRAPGHRPPGHRPPGHRPPGHRPRGRQARGRQGRTFDEHGSQRLLVGHAAGAHESDDGVGLGGRGGRGGTHACEGRGEVACGQVGQARRGLWWWWAAARPGRRLRPAAARSGDAGGRCSSCCCCSCQRIGGRPRAHKVGVEAHGGAQGHRHVAQHSHEKVGDDAGGCRRGGGRARQGWGPRQAKEASRCVVLCR